MLSSGLVLLVLRVVLGAMFIAHGKGKKGFWKMTPNDQMSAGMITLFKFTSVAEILGGIGLVLGVFTYYAALGIALIMVGAMYFKIFKWKSPFSSSEKLGWEIDLLIIAACLVLMTFGAGAYSLMG